MARIAANEKFYMFAVVCRDDFPMFINQVVEIFLFCAVFVVDALRARGALFRKRISMSWCLVVSV